MADAPASNEPVERRALRLGLGVTTAAVVSQLWAWPIAHIAPVLCAVLLLDAAPLRPRAALEVLLTTLAAFAIGFAVSYYLLAVPAVMVVVTVGLVFGLFLFLVLRGPHLLAFVGGLLGLVLTPVLTTLLPALGVVFILAFVLNFAAAIFCAWLAFLVIPVRVRIPLVAHQTIPYRDAAAAAEVTLVMAPLMLGFLLFGWTSILVLVYGVIISLGFDRAGAVKAGAKGVVANLLIAGTATVIAYEVLVMVPSPFMMAAVFFSLAVVFGRRIFAGGPWAAKWMSGMFGALILLGGALLGKDVDSLGEVLKRVWQIGLAMAYVVFAYSLIDLVRGIARYGMRAVWPASRSAADG